MISDWHIHHKGGQILLVTGGRGYYQEWGGQAREPHPGDVVHIPPEVKHWHGAAPDSWFSHLAVEVPAEGSSNEWLGAVSELLYDAFGWEACLLCLLALLCGALWLGLRLHHTVPRLLR